MKKAFLSLSVALLVIGTPAAQAAFVAPPKAVVFTATSNTPVTASGISAEAPAEIHTDASAQPLKTKKLSFFGKLKKYFSWDSSKSKVSAALLALFFGTIGGHRFYMGYKAIGFTMLGLTLLGLGLYIAGFVATVTALTAAAAGTTVAISPLIYIGYYTMLAVNVWSLVDFIRILIGNLQPKNGYFS